jgi:ATP-dependent helicase/nuclease subunit B
MKYLGMAGWPVRRTSWGSKEFLMENIKNRPSTTDLWQQRIIDSWQPGTLILTSGSRMARQLLHRYRLQQIENNQKSWQPLEARSLNGWLNKSWQALWQDKSLAGSWLRLRLWHEIVLNNPLPADLPLDLALCQTLDQTFAVLIRHQLDPTEAQYPSPLVSWRKHVCGEFISALKDVNRFHPAELPMKIAEAIDSGRLSLPRHLILAAFEAVAPVEEKLFHLLSQKTAVAVFPLPREKTVKIQAVTLPDMRQEILYFGQSLLHSVQELRPGAIGVVVPNLELYAPALRRTLNALLGQPSTPREETFNITLGTPLVEHPLAQAALIPLRLLGDEEKRHVLMGLLLSPYYGAWTGHRRQLARLDHHWREMASETDLNALYHQARSREPNLVRHLSPGGTSLLDLLLPFQHRVSLTAEGWKNLLTKLWQSVQFPVLADESDRVAFNHLESTLTSLVGDLGPWTMDSRTFLAWLRQALSVEIFQVAGSEQAGVQVMGLIESRGLAFQRLFLLGMTSSALPQPVRPLPFLDLEERRQILGGTLKSQYEFAHAAFQHLMATAPEIILTRPEEIEGEPLAATPFWPAPWQSATVDFWTIPDAAWSRADWLRSAWKGFIQTLPEETATDHLTTPLPIPKSLSVSSLAVAFQCPFRFLIQELLKLKPLAEPVGGLRPEDRGLSIHQVLACITRKLRARQQEGNLEWNLVFPSVQECVAAVQEKMAAIPTWQVERRRWLGKEFGLLKFWFQEELNHLQAGWRWLAEEIPFEGLTVQGWPTTLNGRIDRVDLHPNLGLLCWDYKSGTSPNSSEVFSHLSQPQLPAYLLAILQGLVKIPGHSQLHKYPLQAGYITLKSEKDLKLDLLGADAEQWRDLLTAWEKRLAELGQQLQRGVFQAKPVPGAQSRERERLCNYCGLLTICDRKSFE